MNLQASCSAKARYLNSNGPVEAAGAAEVTSTFTGTGAGVPDRQNAHTEKQAAINESAGVTMHDTRLIRDRDER